MARKYSRDNRGRFASSGSGATARGGRLRTATGNKRATQTSQMAAAPRAGTVDKGGKARGVAKPAATVKPAQAPVSRIKAPKVGGVSRARLSGQKMNEGAGKRGKARQQRQQTMAIQRQMLGRIKPGKSAEPLSTGGTLAARASLRRARAKAGPGASPAQRGAVKRAGNYLKASKERNRAAVKGAASRGTVAKPKGLKQGAVTARVKARAAAAKPQRKPKSAEDVIAQSNRIDQRSRRMSRAARTGFRARQIESRAESAVKAARARAIELSRPKPESKTAKAKRERAERVRAREQAVNTNRLIMEFRRRRR